MIESASVLVSKCENALSGAALLIAELVLPADVEPLLEVATDVLAVNAFTGGVRVLAEGVYNAEPVRALDPAEVDPFPDEDVAAAPVAFAAEFDWM